MIKNSYWSYRLNNHKISVAKVLVCLALIILLSSFALIQGFAYQLPITPESTYDIITFDGFLSSSYLDMLYSIVGWQTYCGSFNSYQVVAVYYYSGQVRLTLGVGGHDIRFTLTAGTFEPSNTVNSPRFILTTLGFQAYATSNVPSVAEENMLMYRNTDGELVVNSNVVMGTFAPSGILTAYSQWQVAANAVVGGDTQGAYNEGYQDGYDDGRQEGFADGREIGYAEGYQNGYDAGLSVGGGGDVVITEEIDVGSLITALPQAARNIIDGAFGFTIFGINIAATLIAILVVAIVAFIVRWLLRR